MKKAVIILSILTVIFGGLAYAQIQAQGSNKTTSTEAQSTVQTGEQAAPESSESEIDTGSTTAALETGSQSASTTLKQASSGQKSTTAAGTTSKTAKQTAPAQQQKATAAPAATTRAAAATTTTKKQPTATKITYNDNEECP